MHPCIGIVVVACAGPVVFVAWQKSFAGVWMCACFVLAALAAVTYCSAGRQGFLSPAMSMRMWQWDIWCAFWRHCHPVKNDRKLALEYGPCLRRDGLTVLP